jgi:dephospho-CoA kinase
MHALVEQAEERVIVIEAIKLVEGELAHAVDAIWVVNATPQKRNWHDSSKPATWQNR